MSRAIKVFVSGPLDKGDPCFNLNLASRAYRELVAAGFAPLCPHLAAYAGGTRRASRIRDGGGGERADGDVYAVAEVPPVGQLLAVTLPWVAAADALLRLPGESTGADREVWEARLRNIPVFESVAGVLAWAADQTDDFPPPEPAA